LVLVTDAKLRLPNYRKCGDLITIGKEKKEARENYVMRNFFIFTIHHLDL